MRKDLYPQGFRPISDALHPSGRKLLLWFEPQRVCRGTPWAQFRDRPGWLLELKGGNPEYQQRNMNWGVPHEDPRWIERESHRSQICEGDMLWNMGHPEARQFLTDWLSERIKEFGLDWYREDFNIAPLEYWQGADTPDRQGMTEIRFVEGLYAMWDELLRRHPHLAIDNCASGGRRIDLESIGRATALWRTDWPVDAIHRQCHTFGLMQWVPLHMSDGPVLAAGNEYELRSAMTAGLNVKLPPQDDDASGRQAKAMIDQYLGIQKYFYGDFYPLTPYSQAGDAWLAYQLHLPDANEGIVVALKRPASSATRATFRLQRLDRRCLVRSYQSGYGQERQTRSQPTDQRRSGNRTSPPARFGTRALRPARGAVRCFRRVRRASNSFPPTPCRWDGNCQLETSSPSPLAPHRPRVGGGNDGIAIAVKSLLPTDAGSAEAESAYLLEATLAQPPPRWISSASQPRKHRSTQTSCVVAWRRSRNAFLVMNIARRRQAPPGRGLQRATIPRGVRVRQFHVMEVRIGGEGGGAVAGQQALELGDQGFEVGRCVGAGGELVRP